MKLARRTQQVLDPDYFESKFTQSKYCFMDDGTSGDDDGGDTTGFAGDTDASVGGGFAASQADAAASGTGIYGGLGFDTTTSALSGLSGNFSFDTSVGSGFGMGDFGFSGMDFSGVNVGAASYGSGFESFDLDSWSNMGFQVDNTASMYSGSWSNPDAQYGTDLSNVGISAYGSQGFMGQYAELDAISALFDQMNDPVTSAYQATYNALNPNNQIVNVLATGPKGQTMSDIGFLNAMPEMDATATGKDAAYAGVAIGKTSDEMADLVDVAYEPGIASTALGRSRYGYNIPEGIVSEVDQESAGAAAVTIASTIAKIATMGAFPMVSMRDATATNLLTGQPARVGSIGMNVLQDEYVMTDRAYREAVAMATANSENQPSGGDASYDINLKKAAPVATTEADKVINDYLQSAFSTPNVTPYDYNMYEDPYSYFPYTSDQYKSRYGMAEGGVAPEDQQMQQLAAEGGDGPTGFVGTQPENLPEGKTVADDVPLDVEEGTFVINASAVEFAGSEDIKKMIVDAMEEARRQGLDISGDENKINREKVVSLLVSQGEVIVPPLLAKIIGYDKLNKINNRGKEETEKRIAENGQAPEQPANPAEGTAMAAMGMDTRDTDVVDIYSSIQNQGGEPGKFETFRDAMDLYKGAKTYRPMETEPGTPEFDAEVKDKYKLFFSDNPYPLMSLEEIEASKAKDKANMIDTSAPLARVREDGTIYYIDRKTRKEVPAPKQEMAGGGLAEAIEKSKTRDPQFILHDLKMSDDRQNVAGEVIGDGFAVKGRANRAQDARTTEYPNGVVVDEENKNLGFALDGELFLFDDTWLNAGIEKQKGSFKGTANIPTGDKVQFGDSFEMTRYNMGATFGDLSLDVSGMPGEGIDRGRVKYKLNKNRDELFIEGDESGNISAGLRLSI